MGLDYTSPPPPTNLFLYTEIVQIHTVEHWTKRLLRSAFHFRRIMTFLQTARYMNSHEAGEGSFFYLSCKTGCYCQLLLGQQTQIIASHAHISPSIGRRVCLQASHCTKVISSRVCLHCADSTALTPPPPTQNYNYSTNFVSLYRILEVRTAVDMNIAVLWLVTPFSLEICKISSFRRNILPPFSGRNSKLKLRVPYKRLCLSGRVHGVISHETVMLFALNFD